MKLLAAGAWGGLVAGEAEPAWFSTRVALSVRATRLLFFEACPPACLCSIKLFRHCLKACPPRFSPHACLPSAFLPSLPPLAYPRLPACLPFYIHQPSASAALRSPAYLPASHLLLPARLILTPDFLPASHVKTFSRVQAQLGACLPTCLRLSLSSIYLPASSSPSLPACLFYMCS